MNSYIAFAFVVFVATAVNAANVRPIDAINDKCATDRGLPTDFIDKAVRGEVTSDPKCMSECVFKKAGFMNPDGTLNVEVIKRKTLAEEAPEWHAKAIEAINKCTQLRGSNSCETAFKVHKCYFSSVPRKY